MAEPTPDPVRKESPDHAGYGLLRIKDQDLARERFLQMLRIDLCLGAKELEKIRESLTGPVLTTAPCRAFSVTNVAGMLIHSLLLSLVEPDPPPEGVGHPVRGLPPWRRGISTARARWPITTRLSHCCSAAKPACRAPMVLSIGNPASLRAGS
jgi:hypothetical protein